MAVHGDIHHQVKRRLYSLGHLHVASNARSLQENNAQSLQENSQSEHAYCCSYIIVLLIHILLSWLNIIKKTTVCF